MLEKSPNLPTSFHIGQSSFPRTFLSPPASRDYSYNRPSEKGDFSPKERKGKWRDLQRISIKPHSMHDFSLFFRELSPE